MIFTCLITVCWKVILTHRFKAWSLATAVYQMIDRMNELSEMNDYHDLNNIVKWKANEGIMWPVGRTMMSNNITKYHTYVMLWQYFSLVWMLECFSFSSRTDEKLSYFVVKVIIVTLFLRTWYT